MTTATRPPMVTTTMTTATTTTPKSGRDHQRYLPYLAAWRRAAGLTQLDLGSRAYVAKATISYLERGQRPASIELIQRLADALGCDTSELLERPPATADGVIPTTCVQLVERPVGEDSTLPELLFYAPILWNPLEQAISRATRSLDEATRAAERARIASAAGVTVERLEAIAEALEPVSYTLLQRLAALLDCSMAGMIDWRGYTH